MLKRTVSSLMPTTLRRRIIALSMLLVLVLTLSLVGCAGPMPTLVPTPTQEPTPIPTLEPTPNPIPAPAAFQIADLVVDPAEVNPGEKVTIAANLINIRDTKASYTVELKINDIAEIVKEITVPAGTTRVLSFSGYLGSELIPGTYSVSLGERTGQFVVLEPGGLVFEPAELTQCSCESDSELTQCGCGSNSEITGPGPTIPSCCGS